MKRLFLLLFAMGIIILSPANAKIYYVSVPGFPNSGSSLASTIEAARSNLGVDTVFIGFGVYKLDAELIIEDVIIGGCTTLDGVGITRKYPGAVNNERSQQTILDGNSFVRALPSLKHRVATVKPGGIIEGCVIRNGHSRGTTDDPTNMSGFGGGVLVDGGKVHSCIIRGNVAMNLAYRAINPSKGGGVFITDNGGEVVNCIIAFNLDDTGLGVDGNAGYVINNTIARNTNAPKYILIEGTGGIPYRHYESINYVTTTLVLPYIHLNDFYIATTETTQGQYACFLAAIDLASNYSAADWTAMCSAPTPMYGYHEIPISKYLGLTETEVNAYPQLINASTSDPNYLGMSSSNGNDVYYPLKAASLTYAANTDGSTDPSVSNPADPLVRDNFPMNYVSLYGSVAFCAWIGGMLPTEAQWEYAARKKGDGSVQVSAAFAGGYTDVNSVGWSNSNSGGQYHEVATLLPTELGLYDMHGNMHEWCADKHNSTQTGPYPASASTGPTGTAVNNAYMSTNGGVTGGTADMALYNPIYNYGDYRRRVLRGGGWEAVGTSYQLGCRYADSPSSSLGGNVGFRSVACSGL